MCEAERATLKNIKIYAYSRKNNLEYTYEMLRLLIVRISFEIAEFYLEQFNYEYAL